VRGKLVNSIAQGKHRMGLMYIISHCQLFGMFLYPEDGGSNLLQNIVLNLQKYMMPRARRC